MQLSRYPNDLTGYRTSMLHSRGVALIAISDRMRSSRWVPKRLALLISVAAVATANPALAAISFTMGTGNPVTNTQKLHIDSNSCASGAGMRAAYVGGRITNTGATTETNIVATMSGLNATIYLTGGQPASQNIGSLAPGESIGVYWYVGYNCSNLATATPTVSIASSGGTVNSSLNLAISTAISANAGGLISSTTLGPGAIVGQIIPLDVQYTFGGASTGEEYYFQPSGDQTFRADCFRLTGSQVTASIVTAVPAGSVDDLHYVATTSQSGTGKTATIRYYFQYQCANTSTTANPYAAQTSGAQFKYSGNYGATGTTITYPSGGNPVTITKSVSPTSGIVGSTGNLTYTVTLTNPSAYSTVLDRIVDVLPSGMSYVGIGAGSSVTTANSSSTPTAGATGTLTFTGKLGQTYTLAPGGSVTLVYTVTRPTTAGSYVNTASGYIGTSQTPTATSTFSLGNQISATNDNASGINGASGAANITNVLANDSFNNITPPTIAQVTISVTAAASNPGVTLNTATGGVNVAAGTPAGTYTIGYQICETAVPANCAAAIATVIVTAAPIAAADDTVGGINGASGASGVLNVFSGDTLNGAAATVSNTTLAVASGSTVPTGLSFNTATGAIDVNSGTAAGTYSFNYTICETLNPTNCATATATVTVVAPNIVATTDSATGLNGVSGATNVVNVLNNDTLNALQATVANVTTTVTVPASHAGVSLDVATGNVSVAAGTPSGTYTIGYRICETTNPTNCSNSVATIVVAPSVDLTVVKSDGVSSVNSGNTVTYTVVVTNSGPDAVTGAMVTDVVGSGLTCPPSNPVNITGNGIPAGSFTISNLTGPGIALGTLNSGQSATLIYSCQVN